MPATLSSVFILLFALVPGLPGNKAYALAVGRNWREDRWDKSLRLISFSLAGLVLYSLVGLSFGAPVPPYLTVSTLNASLASPSGTLALVAALVGHVLASGISGVVAGRAQLYLAKKLKFGPHSSIWDTFVRECVPNHMVVVALTTGDSYAGFLLTAQTSVATEERDLILEEPARFMEEAKAYKALPYQHLFIPGQLVGSITTLTDPIEDERVTVIGQKLFEEQPSE